MDEPMGKDGPGDLEPRPLPAPALAPVVQRKLVPSRSNYHDHRDDLREDFLFACGYCSMTEAEANAIGFDIDHYLSQKHYPGHQSEYSNLMWSCATCNRLKRDYPEPGRDTTTNHVIKADEENPRTHIELETDTERVRARTGTGRFNIELLLLNRGPLRKLRDLRRRLADNNDFIAHGFSELLNLSLDAVPTPHRAALLTLRAKIAFEYDRAADPIRELIADVSRSPLVDTDPERRQQLAARREYLRTERAIGPGLLNLPERDGRKKAGKKRGRRR